ncbi:MAG: hypothetical protein OHK0015_00370 [Chloroflexi bacterium OHK40]
MHTSISRSFAFAVGFLLLIVLLIATSVPAPAGATGVLGTIIIGTATGNAPRVYVYNARTGQEIASFFAFDTPATGGVYVAAFDVTEDGIDDIIAAPGPGSGAHVRVFDGVTLDLIASFAPYGDQYNGGIRVVVPPRASRPNTPETPPSAVLVTLPALAGYPMRAFSPQNWEQIGEIDPFEGQSGMFSGAILPEAGDSTPPATRQQETRIFLPPVIVMPRGNVPVYLCVQIATRTEWSCSITLPPIPESWTPGTVIVAEQEAFYTAAGYLRPSLVAAGPVQVQMHDPATLAVVRTITAYEESQGSGIELGAGDLNGDGVGDVITGPGPNDPPLVKAFDGQSGQQLLSFTAIDPDYRGGVSVAWSNRNASTSSQVYLPLMRQP